MRKIGWTFLALLTAVAFASAQQFSIGAMPRQFLLFNPKVQAELKLTDAQKKAVAAAGGDSISADGEGRMRMRIGQGTDMETIKNALKKAITPAQDKRLTEVWIQREGPMALNDPDVAKAVGLSDAQKKRVSEIAQDYGDDIRDLAMSSGGRVGPEESKPLRDAARKKLEAVLDKGQKAKFETLKGKPFKWD